MDGGSSMVFDSPTRRAVIGGALALSASQFATAQTSGTLTADQMIDRIRQNVGVPWREQTVDKIVLGDGATPVKGVATTMMATFDVVKQCVAAGMNLIVTHETPVYMHQDDVQPLAKNPTYLEEGVHRKEPRGCLPFPRPLAFSASRWHRNGHDPGTRMGEEHRSRESPQVYFSGHTSGSVREGHANQAERPHDACGGRPKDAGEQSHGELGIHVGGGHGGAAGDRSPRRRRDA